MISPVSQAVPGGGHTCKGLPIYVNAGVPGKGCVLLKSVAVIPDFFYTLINTTSLLTIATFIHRFIRNLRMSNILNKKGIQLQFQFQWQFQYVTK